MKHVVKRHRLLSLYFFIGVFIGASAGCSIQKNMRASHSWLSPNHYRIPLTVDQKGVGASYAPAAVDIDFAAALRGRSKFDRHTVEIIAYNSSGEPVLYDSSRPGYEKYLVPCRLDESF